jgi:hypothetical protein
LHPTIIVIFLCLNVIFYGEAFTGSFSEENVELGSNVEVDYAVPNFWPQKPDYKYRNQKITVYHFEGRAFIKREINIEFGGQASNSQQIRNFKFEVKHKSPNYYWTDVVGHYVVRDLNTNSKMVEDYSFETLNNEKNAYQIQYDKLEKSYIEAPMFHNKVAVNPLYIIFHGRILGIDLKNHDIPFPLPTKNSECEDKETKLFCKLELQNFGEKIVWKWYLKNKLPEKIEFQRFKAKNYGSENFELVQEVIMKNINYEIEDENKFKITEGYKIEDFTLEKWKGPFWLPKSHPTLENW